MIRYSYDYILICYNLDKLCRIRHIILYPIALVGIKLMVLVNGVNQLTPALTEL